MPLKSTKSKKVGGTLFMELISQDLYCTVVSHATVVAPKCQRGCPSLGCLECGASPHDDFIAFWYNYVLKLKSSRDHNILARCCRLFFFLFYFIYDVLIFVHLHIPEGEDVDPALEGIHGHQAVCTIILLWCWESASCDGRQGEDCSAAWFYFSFWE